MECVARRKTADEISYSNHVAVEFCPSFNLYSGERDTCVACDPLVFLVGYFLLSEKSNTEFAFLFDASMSS